jgi:glycosyltransferase involved in cell wall biosynthesis
VRSVHLVVPDGIDDPARPSGGNTYDRHLRRELAMLSWPVREWAVPGFWTPPDAASLAGLEDVLQQIGDDAVVLLDGLIASQASDALVPQARRLRLVVLVHMPLGHRRERAVLCAARAVVTTSAWTRRRVIDLHELDARRVHVAEPGVEAADPVSGTEAGGALLCVAPVTFEKGHDVLLDALVSIRAASWECVCVGRLDCDPAFVEALRRRSIDLGLGDRVSFAGPRTGDELNRLYGEADVLALPSRSETYGMVITEALARGLPVVAADVGGVPEALGHGADGIRPGLLVPPDDPGALAEALRVWLGDRELRARLRRAALERRKSLSPWSATASVVADVLSEVTR